MNETSNGTHGLPKKVLPLAYALLQEVISGRLDPDTLSAEKKQLCVQFMILQQNYTIIDMANILKVTRQTVYNYKKKLYQEDALSQLVIDESTIALELIETANHCSAKLMAQKKFKDAWAVRVECLQQLQSLGYVKKVEKKINIKGSLDLIAVLDLEAELRESETPDYGDEERYGPESEQPRRNSGDITESRPRLEGLQE